MNRWSALALLLAIVGALFLRTPDLGNRPLHNDESTNAIKLGALWDKGDYKYDPHEYHGPTLHYFSLPFLWASGVKSSAEISDARLRLVTVAFGTALILLLFLLRDGLGNIGTAWAAIFLAVSPAMVFYSRYFIHEMLLVFFTLLTLAAGWRYAKKRSVLWSVLTGAGLGLMFATKETFVLTLAAMGFALVTTRLWNRWRAAKSAAPAAAIPYIKWSPTLPHLAVTFGTAAVIWLLFFTSFFTHAAGLVDSFKTYEPWLHRAGGASPHIHSWSFYFERLLWFHPAKSPPWTEAILLVLALIGVAAGFCGNRARVASPPLVRFLSFFTFALTGIYTVIGYKTPWCALNFWLGIILLAGVGAGVLIESLRNAATRTMMLALIGAGALHLGIQAWLLTRAFPADLRNPYVYAQTSPHARELVERVKAIGRVAPEGFATVVKVASPESYWPLPWSLREFKNIGWYDELPADPFAPIVICSAKLDAKLDDKSEKRWIMTGYYELRPNVFLELYVEFGLWEKFVATLPRDTD
ncbi:MAG: TIGR03663 family protein [Verrucomicrobiota bacterium]